jgi:hypothetical protein
MDGARVLQAFLLANEYLSPQAVSAGENGGADHGAVLVRIAEDLPTDDDEHAGAFGIGPRRIGDAVQISTPHDGKTWYSRMFAISAFSATACLRSSADSRV